MATKKPAMILTVLFSTIVLNGALQAQDVKSPVPGNTITPQIQQQDENCAVEDVVILEIPRRPVQQPPTDNRCWLDYKEAQALNPTWIDVRQPSAARKALMLNTLHIPLQQVESKTFLKETPAVLIGTGTDGTLMAMACHQLKAAGFKNLYMLRDGVRAWHQAGQPLQADAETVMALDTISPSEFLYGKTIHSWHIVAINLTQNVLTSTDESDALSLKEAQHLDEKVLADLTKRLQKTLQANASEASGRPTPVIVAENDAMTDALRDAMMGKDIGNALWLDGGWEKYVAYVEQQQRVAAIAAHPKPLRKPCGS